MAADQRTLFYQLDDDASFRQWVAGLDAALIACGLVLAGDTGQLDPTTVTKPAAAGVAGYRIYRFNDALQATKPVFIKVQYGVAAISTWPPRLIVQVGTATNGAGALAGVTTPARTLDAFAAPTTDQTTTAWTSGNMADNARILLHTGGSAAPDSSQYNRGAGFCVERSKDLAGDDTNEALHFLWWAGTVAGQQSLSWTALGVVADASLPILHPQGSMVSASDVGVSPCFPQFGKFMAPLVSVFGYWQTDMSILTPVPVTLYGVTRNYLPLGGNTYGNWLRGGVGNNTVNSLLFLFE